MSASDETHARVSRRVAERLRGRFVVLDGPDGAGKSTQHRMLEQSLRDERVAVLSCRDPGGTEIGDRIRGVLLNHDLSKMDVHCEVMLFMASRAQLVAEVIRPALSSGSTVLCDRFVTSTCAYQGAAGYDPRRTMELARFALNDFWPDATVLLDIDPEEGFARIGRKAHHAGRNRPGTGDQPLLIADAEPDAMEARPLEFHRRVRELFLRVHEDYPTPVVTVDARGDVAEVHRRILEALANVPLGC